MLVAFSFHQGWRSSCCIAEKCQNPQAELLILQANSYHSILITEVLLYIAFSIEEKRVELH